MRSFVLQIPCLTFFQNQNQFHFNGSPFFFIISLKLFSFFFYFLKCFHLLLYTISLYISLIFSLLPYLYHPSRLFVSYISPNSHLDHTILIRSMLDNIYKSIKLITMTPTIYIQLIAITIVFIFIICRTKGLHFQKK